jgi:hypothetical protein
VKIADARDRLRRDQRNIAGKHQHVLKATQRLASLHHGVSGAALFALQHEADAGGFESGPHLLGFVPDDGEDVLWRHNLHCGRDNVSQQRLAGNLVQHLGMARLQARAFSGGENRDGESGALVLRGICGGSFGHLRKDQIIVGPISCSQRHREHRKLISSLSVLSPIVPR